MSDIYSNNKHLQTQLKYQYRNNPSLNLHFNPSENKITNSLFDSEYASNDLTTIQHLHPHRFPKNSSQTKLHYPIESNLHNKYKQKKNHSNSTYSLRGKYSQYNDEIITNDHINCSVIIKGSNQQNCPNNFYEEFILSKREMHEYNKRVKLMNTRINTLKRQDDNLKNKVIIMQKREVEVEEIIKAKRKFKAKLQYVKDLKLKETEIRKEELRQKKTTEKEKSLKSFKEKMEKRQLDFEKMKANNTVVRSMISQSNQKNETLNKYKYLQIKEGYIEYHTNEELNTIEHKEQIKDNYVKKIKENISNISALKSQYNQLEKIEGDYIDKIKQTKQLTMKFKRHFSPQQKSIVRDEEEDDDDDNNIKVNETDEKNKKNIRKKRRHHSVSNHYKIIPMNNQIENDKSKIFPYNNTQMNNNKIKPIPLTISKNANNSIGTITNITESNRNYYTTRSNYSSNYTTCNLNNNNNNIYNRNNKHNSNNDHNKIKKKTVKKKQLEYDANLKIRSQGNNNQIKKSKESKLKNLYTNNEQK